MKGEGVSLFICQVQPVIELLKVFLLVNARCDTPPTAAPKRRLSLVGGEHSWDFLTATSYIDLADKARD